MLTFLKRNTLSSLIRELCKSKDLKQHVTIPTRVTNTSSTLIDLILSNSKYVKECNVVDLGLSDHSLVHIRRDRVKINRPHKTTLMVLIFSGTNFRESKKIVFRGY